MSDPLLHTSPIFPIRPVWFATRRFRVGVLALLAVALLGEGAMAVFVRMNDLANHYHQGDLLLHPDPAADADHYRYVPYPAGRATLNALFAWLPYRVFRATLYVLALASLVGTFNLWERMAARHRPVAPESRFVAAISAIALLGPWVARDLDDCGLQILLLFMLSMCSSLWERGRDGASAGWLGVAVAYKATPLLLVPFALLTGRWRAAGGAMVVVVALCLSPALFIGWNRTIELNRGFMDVAIAGAQADEPGANGFEPPRHKNQSLTLAVGRLLLTYPPDHPLYVAHPLFVQFFDLEPRTAKRVATIGIVLALAALAWRIGRKTWRDGQAADLVPEWATLCFLCALLSPVCWGPHLTLGLPAAYLILRDFYDRLARRARPCGWQTAGLVAVAALINGLPRELLGVELSIVVLSYKPYTLAAVILIVMVLALSPRPIAPTDSVPERLGA